MKNIKTFSTAVLFGLAIALTGLAFQPSTALAQPAQKYNDEGKKIVPYVPTPQEVVERMLDLAQVRIRVAAVHQRVEELHRLPDAHFSLR